MNQFYLRFAFFLLAITLPLQRTMAQGTTTSAMSGIVTDKSGGGLPGATVIALHTPTNTQYAATTNVDGRYNIQNMRVGGPYTVRTTYVGYQDQARENINLTLGQNLKLDFTITESTIGLSEVEIVGTRNTVINADRTGAATSISRQQIETLPTLSRSIQDFTRLTPQANGNAFAGRSSSFNNVSIDGALFNNAFGLSGNLGGQTNANPISLDAIDQIQVQIAPFDVRQGSFTGAGINAVTRSGTNNFSGSAYYFFRNPGLVGRDVNEQHLRKQQFDLGQVGFRLGGPIIKNKVFFFVNYERERRTDPGTTFLASRPGLTGIDVTTVNAADLDQLSAFMAQKYGYQTGGYENYDFQTNSDKATVKIDWNINARNNFSLKYNYLDSYRDQIVSNSGGTRQPGRNTLPFESSGYAINNNFNSFIAELNSKISDKFSNNLIVGYTGLRDFRESKSTPFPLVEIENGTGAILTTFGYEPFTAFNILNSDIYQLSDNFNISLGKHVITLGTSNEAYHFKNGFAPNYYGRFRYRSLQDFYTSAETGASTAYQYQIQYAANPTGDFPYAEINALQLGFYAQDEYTVKDNLKFTLGIRTDIPMILSDLPRNENLEKLTFRDGRKVDVSQFQKTTPLWSPRLGFNWDVNNDQKTQIRGGLGIFTGRVPYVWVSNQASNNGVLFGSLDERISGSTGFVPNRPFNPNVNTGTENPNPYIPNPRVASTSYNIAVTAPDFKFPQVFRTNLAIDRTLPFGIVATLEGIYTKDLNAVYHQNINLPAPAYQLKGADNRLTYYVETPGTNPGETRYTANNRIYGSVPAALGGNTAAQPNISDVILMANTKKGYSYAITGQLQKQFNNGLNAMLAYTYSDARSVNDGGSIAQSIWRDRVVVSDPNANDLSYSNYLQRHRIVASVGYRKEYLNRLATSIALFYEAGPNFRFSYTYNGDINGDGQTLNDLIYVPATAGDILFEDIKSGSGQVLYAAADQSRDFFNYIEQDDYLRSRKGKYAERNGAESPWVSNLDLRITQDVFQNIGGKKNTLQFTADIFNAGNRLNSGWSIRDFTNRAQVLSYRRIETAAGPNQGKPVFTFPYQNAATNQVLSTTYGESTAEVSRWRAQIGIRYIFN